MFFNNLSSFDNNVALIDCHSKQKLTFSALDEQSNTIAESLGNNKELVFIEANNNIASVVAYVACLKANKVVYLLENLEDKKVQSLLALYKPEIIIKSNGQISRTGNNSLELHKDVTLLLSTSGSTGTPKFVKLSAKNIHSNAMSIAEYLRLSEHDVAMSHLKLHYSYGISVLHSHLAAGATTALTDHGVLDEEFWLDVNDLKATSFAGVPYTYESLDKSGFDFKQYPSLRYVTQAGGKLESNLVQKYVENTAKSGIDFFVMYGQTEAAPRISYLPPDLAREFPGSIGKAIPGGILTIVDESGHDILEQEIPGELAYQGNNVMMGYAEKPEDLAIDETPEKLLTGDIACKTKNDLFYIVGRTKRFVKLFGLRINLDDVQSFVKKIYQQSAVTGDDDKIVIAIENNSNADHVALITSLSEQYLIPKNKFSIIGVAQLPLLISGKYDYKTIMSESTPKVGVVKKVIDNVLEILGLNTTEWDNINDLFVSILQVDSLDDKDTFNDLNADSLSFVQLSIELEHCLGDELPENWQECTIGAMNDLYQKSKLS